MGKTSVNVLNLSESALNSLKNLELIQKIFDLKGKVRVDAELLDLPKLSDQTSKLTETIYQISLQINWLLHKI